MHVFVQIMAGMTALSPAEIVAIEQSFPLKTYPKDAYLLKAGQLAINGYYVISGCIRAYSLEDGEEKTTDFFTEGGAAVDFLSQATGSPSRLHFVCTEETEVVIVNQKKEQQLYKTYPRFEAFCRAGMEEMVGQQQQKLRQYVSMSPKERYLNLLQERPDLLMRVPQYQLASYLGITPETLSRIRKRITLETKELS